MTKANGDCHGETWRGSREGNKRVRAVERWTGWWSQRTVCQVRSTVDRNKYLALIWLFHMSWLPIWCYLYCLLFAFVTVSTLPSSISCHSAAESLALFKICIRMLFLYSSKRRHVEFLLNCSANRWRFSRCLYEIKWNIPIKKTFSRVPSLSHSLLLPYSSLCLFCFPFFWLASGLGKGTLLLKVKWKVDRFVLPITTSPGKQAPNIRVQSKQVLWVQHCKQRVQVSLLHCEPV